MNVILSIEGHVVALHSYEVDVQVLQITFMKIKTQP